MGRPAGEEGEAVSRLARLHAPSPGSDPEAATADEAASADRPIRFADMGGLRGSGAGARAKLVPDEQGTAAERSPPADHPGADPVEPAADTSADSHPNTGSDTEEQPSLPVQNTDTARDTNSDAGRGAHPGMDDEPGHGDGHPPASFYPVDPEHPPVQVPEPGTLGLLIVGLLGCAARRRTVRRAGSSTNYQA
ncbi:PEP-CTERM sorting domain-containing protein [Steroidobacter denitrificans]|nr:PEP-CTERM sorting domain-containing protein [Steroidobacter denitrificans]